MALVVVTVVVARRLRWSPRTLVLALATSIAPLATAVLDAVAPGRGRSRDHRAMSVDGATISR